MYTGIHGQCMLITHQLNVKQFRKYIAYNFNRYTWSWFDIV